MAGLSFNFNFADSTPRFGGYSGLCSDCLKRISLVNEDLTRLSCVKSPFTYHQWVRDNCSVLAYLPFKFVNR